MPPPVFHERERADDRPKARGEGLFAFYDRSPRRPFRVFRDLVNRWVAELPADGIAEVVARMRGGEDLGFATGLSEIVLHAALQRLGFVLEAHPVLPATTNRLDFLIRRPAGERLAYLEITTINRPDAHAPRNRREAVVFEALDAASLPEDIRLSYEIVAYGQASPSARRIKAAVERWAVGRVDAARGGAHISEEFHFDDWHFRLGLLAGFNPRPGGRQIALYGTINGRIVGAPPSTEGLRAALNAKATRYGELDLPYVIAVFDRTESLAYFSRDFPLRVTDVLFGSERTLVSINGEISHDRALDGWFGHIGAPRRQGVSAVLIFPSAEPWWWAEQRGQPLLVRNPWPKLPLQDGVFPTQEFVISEQEGRVIPGRSIAQILGLPDPWPPDE